MPYSVTIQDRHSGETVTCQEDLPWRHERGASEFWWSEGNYGCDCNRGMEFMRAKGATEEEVEAAQAREEIRCCWSDDPRAPRRYRVVSIVLPSGAVVYSEEDSG